ncbi:MAG TPA: hypothetical protein PLQ76_09625, partial [bacterium]|nr:hypothetical protein [bacterium]
VASNMGNAIFVAAYLIMAVNIGVGISRTHYNERENWVAPARRIAEDAKPGDTLVADRYAETGLRRYIPAKKIKSLNIVTLKRDKDLIGILSGRSRSWIVLSQSHDPERKREHMLDDLLAFDPAHDRYGGLLVDIRMARVDGYFLDRTLTFDLGGAGMEKAVQCESNGMESCNKKIFVSQNEAYNFILKSPEAIDTRTGKLTVCGRVIDIAKYGSGKEIKMTLPLVVGTCEVTYSTKSRAPKGEILTITKVERGKSR